MEKCTNCWTLKMDCRTCPYRVREAVKPVNTKQDFTGVVLIFIAVLILIAI